MAKPRNTITTTIDMSGPFFRKDPALTFRENGRVMMDGIAAEGAADVIAQLRAGESGRAPMGGGITPNRVSGHVVGRTHNLKGKRWAVTAVVSVNNTGLTGYDVVPRVPRFLRRTAIGKGFRKGFAAATRHRGGTGVILMAAASEIEGRTHIFRNTTNRLRRARDINVRELLKDIA